MTNFSNWMEAQIIQISLRNGSWSAVANPYISLLTTMQEAGGVFTETDAAFIECEHHNKHIFPWNDVIVRDVETMEPVPIGEKGLMNVINPSAYSYAGVSILQDDIVRIIGEDTCPCGRKGKIMEIFGRAEGAEMKGCGAQVAEMTDD